jgi:uncharacterized protein YbjT (DUF2867 family)
LRKILVLGATGNIGGPLLATLSDTDISIRAAARNPEEARKKVGVSNVEWVPFQYEMPNTYARAFEGVTDLFLLTPADPRMVELTGQVMEWAKKSGVGKVVKVSAIGTSLDARFAFARWHYEAEKMVEASGIRYAFLRPNGFMQNYLGSYASSMKKQNAFYAPIGDAKVSYIDSRDIARVAAVFLVAGQDKENTKVDLTGPHSLSNVEIAEIISKTTGRTIQYVPVSPDQALKAMKASGMPDWRAEALIDLCQTYANGEASMVTSAVQEITGTVPNSFEKFAAEYKNSF